MGKKKKCPYQLRALEVIFHGELKEIKKIQQLSAEWYERLLVMQDKDGAYTGMLTLPSRKYSTDRIWGAGEYRPGIMQMQEYSSAAAVETLLAIDKGIPGLNIAAIGYVVEDDNDMTGSPSAYYSPAGSQTLVFGEAEDGWYRDDKFPEDAWVPYAWRHPGEAPNTLAAAELTFHGEWPAEMKAAVLETLQDERFYEELGYSKFGDEAVVEQVLTAGKDKIRILVGGILSSVEVAQNINMILFYYYSRERYGMRRLKEFLRKMRQARCSILVEAASWYHPDGLWGYSAADGRVAHILLSSTGEIMEATTIEEKPAVSGRYEGAGLTIETLSEEAPQTYDVNNFIEGVVATVVEALEGRKEVTEQLLMAIRIQMARFLVEYPLPEIVVRAEEEGIAEEEKGEYTRQSNAHFAIYQRELDAILERAFTLESYAEYPDQEEVKDRVPFYVMAPKLKGLSFCVVGNFKGAKEQDIITMIQNLNGKVKKIKVSDINAMCKAMERGKVNYVVLGENVDENYALAAGWYTSSCHIIPPLYLYDMAKR